MAVPASSTLWLTWLIAWNPNTGSVVLWEHTFLNKQSDSSERTRQTTILYRSTHTVRKVSLGCWVHTSLLDYTKLAAVVKKAQLRLCFLRIFRKKKKKTTCRRSCWCPATTAPLGVCWRTASLRGMTAAQRWTVQPLQRVINNDQKTIGYLVPPLEDLLSSCCLSREANKVKDPSLPRTSSVWPAVSLAGSSGPSCHRQTDLSTTQRRLWTDQSHTGANCLGPVRLSVRHYSV